MELILTNARDEAHKAMNPDTYEIDKDTANRLYQKTRGRYVSELYSMKLQDKPVQIMDCDAVKLVTMEAWEGFNTETEHTFNRKVRIDKFMENIHRLDATFESIIWNIERTRELL